MGSYTCTHSSPSAALPRSPLPPIPDSDTPVHGTQGNIRNDTMDYGNGKPLLLPLGKAESRQPPSMHPESLALVTLTASNELLAIIGLFCQLPADCSLAFYWSHLTGNATSSSSLIAAA